MRTPIVSQVEVATIQPDLVRRFYAVLFGWHFSADGIASRTLSIVPANTNGIRGVISSAGEGHSSALTMVVEVDDVLENVCYAEELGGHIIELPHDIISAGRQVTVASFADPEGNRVGLSNGSKKLASAPERPA